MKKELVFRKIDLAAAKDFAAALNKDPARTENSSFATNYLWQDYFNISYAKAENCIVLRYVMDGETSYAFPFGGTDREKLSAVKKLSRLCRKEGRALFLAPITEEDRVLLESELPGLFAFSEERSEFEYVYRREKLEKLDEFSDLRYKKKLIEQLKSRGNLVYEKISASNMHRCMEVEELWLAEKMDSLKDRENYEEEKAVLLSEHKLILRAFENFEELKLFGGFLTLDQKPVAFTIAEKQNEDTVLVHIEKAIKGVKGAYQAINNFFITQSCGDFSFVNREEDTGDLHLRQAKMSYRPDKLVKIYSAQENLPVFRFLEKEEYQKTKKICEDIFDGEENREFFEDFFREKIYGTRIAVLELEGKIIAHTQIWSITCRKKKAAPYLYATATLPRYRLLGFRDMLLEKLFSVLGKEGFEWVFLAPENRNIWGSLGFDISFDVSHREKELLEIDDEIDCCLVHEIKPGSFSRPEFF